MNNFARNSSKYLHSIPFFVQVNYIQVKLKSYFSDYENGIYVLINFKAFTKKLYREYSLNFLGWNKYCGNCQSKPRIHVYFTYQTKNIHSTSQIYNVFVI